MLAANTTYVISCWVSTKGSGFDGTSGPTTGTNSWVAIGYAFESGYTFYWNIGRIQRI